MLLKTIFNAWQTISEANVAILILNVDEILLEFYEM